MAAVATQPLALNGPSSPSTTQDGDACGLGDNSCGGADFQSFLSADDTLPSQQALDKAGDLTVQDADGKSHTFRSLHADTSKRTLIIFVRHFYCGLCIHYLRALSASLSPTSLTTLPHPTRLLVIGCGSPSVIPLYASKTTCPFPIYADPTRKLYAALSMGTTLELGPKPTYQSGSTLDVIARSFVDVATSGANIWKSGNYLQIGGEFLVEGGEVVWCHRMRNTRDHTEVGELRRVLGMEGE